MSAQRDEARSLRDEGGISLVELLVVLAIAVMVMAGVVQLMVMSVRQQPEVSERNGAIQQSQVVTERIVRELRESSVVLSGSGSQITFVTLMRRVSCGSSADPPASDPAIECKLTYACSSGRCTRSEGPVSGSAVSTEEVIDGIANSDSVFSFTPNVAEASYVGVRLELPVGDDGREIAVEDGTELRNRG